MTKEGSDHKQQGKPHLGPSYIPCQNIMTPRSKPLGPSMTIPVMSSLNSLTVVTRLFPWPIPSSPSSQFLPPPLPSPTPPPASGHPLCPTTSPPPSGPCDGLPEKKSHWPDTLDLACVFRNLINLFKTPCNFVDLCYINRYIGMCQCQQVVQPTTVLFIE